MFLILAFGFPGAAMAQHNHGALQLPGSRAPDHQKRAAEPAQPLFFDAEVRAVDRESATVTLSHGAIRILDMPATTAVYAVKDATMLDQVGPGDRIRFTGVLQARQFIVTKILAPQ